MVLVDTSIWLRFLADQSPWAAELDRLLSLDVAVGHELVLGELLIGYRSGDERSGRGRLLADYSRMSSVQTVAHAEVVEFVRVRRLHGRGVGWIDIHLLAAAVVAGVRLWTVDERLAGFARELGVAWTVSAV